MTSLLLLFSGGAMLVLKSALVPAKAFLAPILIERAWLEGIQAGEPVKPWSWLDSEAVAKVSFEGHDASFVVLRGVSGQVLAFAPGWHEQSASIGEGVSIISAHRDTHFKVLEHVKRGDLITAQNIKGQEFDYMVKEIFVTETPELIFPKGENAIYLVTCYPFGDWGKNPQQRYIVKAVLNKEPSNDALAHK
jgi:sortase A